jgi:hypothetical protein
MRKLNMIEIEEILYRWRQGLKVKEITRSLGYARNRPDVRIDPDFGHIHCNLVKYV